MIETLIFSIEIIGTIAFALSGALRGIEKQLDLLGITILGVTAATGGGLIRDILLGSHPPLLFVNPIYVIVAALTAVIAFIVAYITQYYHYQFKNHLSSTFGSLLNLADAIGLGIFAVIGVQTAIQGGFFENTFLTLFVGIITGVGGGMLRDVLVGEIPFFLKKHIYFLAALLGSTSYYLLVKYDINDVIAMTIGSLLTFLIRLLASKYRWNLPKIPSKACADLDHVENHL